MANSTRSFLAETRHSKLRDGEAYAVEELRAEICSAILAAETGLPLSQIHVDNYVAYLAHWLEVVSDDPMGIFPVIKNAGSMAEF